MARIVAHALEGVDPPVAGKISGDPEAVREASAGLPDGAATPEAIAARVRRSGGELAWGAPARHGGRTALLRLCRARGVSSVALVRADPSLLPELQIGSWFDSRFFRRLARSAALATRMPPRLLRGRTATDAAFWRGVRSVATAHEWRRLTQSSYVVLLYHRVAGEQKPAQERLDVSPVVFERHVRWLRRLGCRPVGMGELIAFHTDPEATLPRRAVLVSADDGFRDAVLAFGRHTDLRPIVFVSTAAVGGVAPWEWADGEPIVSWEELELFVTQGGEVGSHAQTHVPLPELEPSDLHAELVQSWRELQERVSRPAPLLAYPHGQNDEHVRVAAAAAGYRAAFSTDAGRNGAGTDAFRLRRIEPKDWDGALVFAWKALTGEPVPWSIERVRRCLRDRPRRARPRPRSSRP